MKKLSATLVGSLLALPLWAGQLSLQPEQSRLHFVSVKNDAVAEVHQFSDLRGELDDKTGLLQLSIGLDSVETNIDIRNERMRKLLFETEQFARATLTAQVDMKGLKFMVPGQQKQLTVPARLTLHGQSADLELEVAISRLLNGGYNAHSLKPVVIQASSFALVAGVEKLREIAGLKSIDTAVPVSFSANFK